MVGECAPRAAPPAQNTPKPQNAELKLDSSGTEGLGRLSPDGEDAPAGSPGLAPPEEAHAGGCHADVSGHPTPPSNYLSNLLLLQRNSYAALRSSAVFPNVVLWHPQTVHVLALERMSVLESYCILIE